MIKITKAERARLKRLFPLLAVQRTRNGKYLLCEESRYLRALPGNAVAAQALEKNQRGRGL